MSDLRHQSEGELRQSRRSCVTYIGRLKSKVCGQQERLKWINYYIKKKENKI